MSLVVMTDKLGPELVVKVLGFASGLPCPYKEMYLKEYTPLHDNKGTFTYEPSKAKRYPSMEEFYHDYRFSIGTRADGRPDRPLTAFDLEIIKIEDCA